MTLWKKSNKINQVLATMKSISTMSNRMLLLFDLALKKKTKCTTVKTKAKSDLLHITFNPKSPKKVVSLVKKNLTKDHRVVMFQDRAHTTPTKPLFN